MKAANNYGSINITKTLDVNSSTNNHQMSVNISQCDRTTQADTHGRPFEKQHLDQSGISFNMILSNNRISEQRQNSQK